MKKTYQILIVDDNELMAEGLKLLLEHAGHAVHTAYNGTDALAYARVHQPEVIILDLSLPDMDGYEIAQKLHEEKIPTLTLIALTGHSERENTRKAFRAGFDHYLVKPISVSDIEKLL